MDSLSQSRLSSRVATQREVHVTDKLDQGPKDQSPKVEILVVTTQDNLDRLEALQAAGGWESLNALFNDAFQVLEWVTEQQGKNLVVGATASSSLLAERLPSSRDHRYGQGR